MNNCWFRIQIHPVMTAQGLALRFQHPTLAGAQAGGWMDAEHSHASGAPSGPVKTSVPEAGGAPSLGGAAAAGTGTGNGAGQQRQRQRQGGGGGSGSGGGGGSGCCWCRKGGGEGNGLFLHQA